ncbi:hypothetical protein NST63_17940 [Heyndrickxia sp. FSL W8-0496]|uniref:hypothetical protein n=1 Tax=Heyndrickxia sp. FSL W8-0496 TaxID=2954702 RepID=UPI0030F4E016
MPFTKMNEFKNLIAKLPDVPNGTMTSAELKKYWDSSPEELRAHYNKLVDELQASTASMNIGAAEIEGLDGSNLQEILTSLKAFIDAHKNDKKNPHGVTAAQLDVYTKQELAPFLQGGETFIKEEVFIITSSNNGDGTFTYTDKNQISHNGTLTDEGYQIFTLLEGKYKVGENRIDAYIDDVLRRSVASGGLAEISPTEVALTIPEGTGREITFKYFGRIGIAGEHNLVVGPDKPPVGDGKTVWFKVD